VSGSARTHSTSAITEDRAEIATSAARQPRAATRRAWRRPAGARRSASSARRACRPEGPFIAVGLPARPRARCDREDLPMRGPRGGSARSTSTTRAIPARHSSVSISSRASAATTISAEAPRRVTDGARRAGSAAATNERVAAGRCRCSRRRACGCGSYKALSGLQSARGAGEHPGRRAIEQTAHEKPRGPTGRVEASLSCAGPRPARSSGPLVVAAERRPGGVASLPGRLPTRRQITRSSHQPERRAEARACERGRLGLGEREHGETALRTHREVARHELNAAARRTAVATIPGIAMKAVWSSGSTPSRDPPPSPAGRTGRSTRRASSSW